MGDFTEYSSKALNGWVKGSKVSGYDGVYNLFLREHLFSNCFTELRLHTVDSKLTVPSELAKEADLWLSTRVHKKVTGSDTKKGGSGPLPPAE